MHVVLIWFWGTDFCSVNVKVLLALRVPVDLQVVEEWRVRRACLESLGHLVHQDWKEITVPLAFR